MTIGVTLNDKHCYDDYGMWLVNVDISQPEVQTHYVQVPGRTGELDLTEALTGDVRYYNGTTTMTFQTAEKVCGRSWFEQLELVREDLHGKRATFIFDGTNIEYLARCEVSGTPTAGGIYEITVTATVDAHKALPPFAFWSADDDSLNFYCDYISKVGDTYKGKTVSALYEDVESTGSDNPEWFSKREDIKLVVIDSSFAGARPTSCRYWFRDFTACTEITGLAHLDTSEVTRMDYMFYGCSKVTSLNVSGFDTSSATHMGDMFYGCSALTYLDVAHFNTSKVTSMVGMFEDCSALISLDVARFDTSNVTSMNSMFYGCSGLGALDVSAFNTSNVTNMGNMFRGCSGLTELDVSMLDTAKVTSIGSMFRECSNLTTIYSNDDVFVTSAITSSTGVFTDCTKLVGGNGTTYDSSKTDYTYAHVDTASNPGYFTGK